MLAEAKMSIQLVVLTPAAPDSDYTQEYLLASA